MLNELIEAISTKLKQVFGAETRVYSEPLEQGQRPCFFITVLKPSETPLLGNRFFRSHPFDVQYSPAVAENNAELQEMAANLFDALEFVTMVNDDLVHGTKMNYEIVDGVLHFYVNYNMFLKKVKEPVDNMEALTVNNEVRG